MPKHVKVKVAYWSQKLERIYKLKEFTILTHISITKVGRDFLNQRKTRILNQALVYCNECLQLLYR